MSGTDQQEELKKKPRGQRSKLRNYDPQITRNMKRNKTAKKLIRRANKAAAIRQRILKNKA